MKRQTCHDAVEAKTIAIARAQTEGRKIFVVVKERAHLRRGFTYAIQSTKPKDAGSIAFVADPPFVPPVELIKSGPSSYDIVRGESILGWVHRDFTRNGVFYDVHSLTPGLRDFRCTGGFLLLRSFVKDHFSSAISLSDSPTEIAPPLEAPPIIECSQCGVVFSGEDALWFDGPEPDGDRVPMCRECAEAADLIPVPGRDPMD
jgi:hypothetical protein